jgi:hypothetical protein
VLVIVGIHTGRNLSSLAMKVFSRIHSVSV